MKYHPYLIGRDSIVIPQAIVPHPDYPHGHTFAEVEIKFESADEMNCMIEAILVDQL
jgi:hypothetical protein